MHDYLDVLSNRAYKYYGTNKNLHGSVFLETYLHVCNPFPRKQVALLSCFLPTIIFQPLIFVSAKPSFFYLSNIRSYSSTYDFQITSGYLIPGPTVSTSPKVTNEMRLSFALYPADIQYTYKRARPAYSS